MSESMGGPGCRCVRNDDGSWRLRWQCPTHRDMWVMPPAIAALLGHMEAHVQQAVRIFDSTDQVIPGALRAELLARLLDYVEAKLARIREEMGE
jgi:hypothetical protein